jgi:arylsulfatase A-like enzyme
VASTTQTDARLPNAPRPRPRARLRSFLGRQLWPLLELFVLTGFAVAQPLLDVIGRSPDFLLFRQADARDIAVLAFTITFGPALVLWGLELLAGLAGRRVQQAVHLALVGGLMAVLGLEVAKKLTPLRGPALVAVGALVGIGAGVLYARASAFRLWLRYASPAPLVFLLVFLLVSPTAELLRPAPATAAQPAGGAQRGDGAPVVIILLDELPTRSLLDHTGQIDRRLYPNFAKLAGQSTWYRNATGVSGLTNWAMPAMFTGRYPAWDVAPIAARYPNNLFRLLGRSGYDMRVFEGITQLCPPRTCAIQATPGGQGGFRRVARDSARLWTEISSPRDSAVDPTATLEEDTIDANDQAAAGALKAGQDTTWVKRPASLDGFLAALRPTGGPSAHFLHILLPHQPWKYLPSGLKYPERPVGEGPLKDGRWTTEPWPVQSTHQRHLMQTAYTDRLLGTIIKQMQTTGMYDRSLVVVTADHGLAFTPGEEGRSTVTEATAPDVLWVPLFIKRPGQQDPSVNDVNFEHVDLAPTISEMVGLQIPWATDGVSWADPSKPMRERTEKWFYPRPAERTVVQGSGNRDIALQGLSDRVVRVGDDYLDWFKLGPSADLVGQRVGDLAVGDRGGRARVIGLDDYRRIDPSSGQVPAQLGGQLTSMAAGLPARPAVAVALNGVIAGMSETFTSGDDPTTWFSTMVPDSLMRRGENKLELFLVDTAGGQRRLRPLTLTS